MKIVAVSNLRKETVDDILICENINRTHGEVATEAFNRQLCGTYGEYFYTLMDDSYKLYKWEP
jgi:hypothetical protein